MIMRGLLIKETFVIALIVVSNLVALFVEEMLFTSSAASAQIPLVPPPTIQITSHQDGNQVPTGELTIQGTSSDSERSNCQIYADVNDVAPLQNATAVGVGGDDDYSKWTFTYTQAYQPITEGVNELTAKISCFGDGGATMPLSEWHSVNVTGLASDIATPTPAMRQAPLTESTLGGGQEPGIFPTPDMSPSFPFVASEEPLEDSSQDQGEEGENGGEDDDDGDDDGGEDDG